MILERKRGAPKGHDGVADIFVQGARGIENDPGHRRQVGIHQTNRVLGAQRFGQFRKVAHIAEENRKRPGFAAQPGWFVAFGEFLHHAGRDIARESFSNTTTPGLRPQAPGRFHREVDQGDGGEGIYEIQPHPELGEGQDRPPDQHSGEPRREDEARQHPLCSGNHENQEQAHKDDQAEFHYDARILPADDIACEEIVEHVGMDLDAREHTGKGRARSVAQADLGGPDQCDGSLQLASGNAARENIPRAHPGKGFPRPPEIDQDLPALINGNHLSPHPNFSKGASVRHELSSLAGGDLQEREGERHVIGIPAARHQGGPANHAIGIAHRR